MRQLKFRAWDGEKMISPDYIDRQGAAHWKADSIPTTSNKVMQFTGLHDKNGKDIFEGDIIKTPLGHICIIKWDHVREVKTDDAYEYTGFCYHNVAQSKNYHFDEAHRCEVIGNIHEHPHLLKP